MSAVRPAIDVREVNFDLSPYVLKENDAYFLVYKVQVKENGQPRLEIKTRKTSDKIYYWIVGKTSFPEYQHVVKRPVSNETGARKLLESGAVYWLNPDKSEVKLKIVDE